MNSLPWMLTILLTVPAGSFGATVTQTGQHAPPASAFVLSRAEVDLPGDGVWELRTSSHESVRQLYLIPPREALGQHLGRRSAAARQQQRIDQPRWNVRMIYDACLEFARNREGIGPAALNDLDPEKYRYLLDRLDQAPWWDWDPTAEGERPTGPFVFLVPRARFHFVDDEQTRVPAEQRELLAFELRPYVNDGQHWVLYTDGSCLRDKILNERLERHQVRLQPITSAPRDPAQPTPTTLPYSLVAVLDGSANRAFDVTLHNPISGAEMTIAWPAGSAREDPTVLATLGEGRRHAWQPYLRTGPAPILRTWLSNAKSIDSDQARPDENLTMFALLGGRTAVEETLQLQNLDPRGSTETANIPVTSLTGVTVLSHPFAEMLGTQAGGRLELADLAPPDRFFVYVAQPKAILPFLEKGAGFLAAAGTGLTGNQLDYDLTRRYLDRAGLTRSWLETVLRSGLIRDLALMVPDLFFIDGTDVTVAARLNQPQLLGTLLAALGIRGLGDGSVLEVTTPTGHQACWSLQDDLLLISTHRAELDRVLELSRLQGQGSLGRTDEFRYMLTQMPVRPETRFLAYFSDPFIRRLVGPEVKLGQMRRIQTRARMEAITAQALLAGADGLPPASSTDQLVRWGYLPEGFPVEATTIDDRGVVHSAVYGTMGDMQTLLAVPTLQVTPAEADAYRRYVENYSRFWSQFFDPIAMRLDDANGSLELSTFILPLINNSIYDGLREALLHHEDRHPLVIPVVEPTPVLHISLNLQDRVWQGVAGGFGELFRHYGGVSPALLDDLGPAVHLSVFDADPVLALGSGDLLGAFGGNMGRMGGFNRSEMLLLPVALSALTRPCTLRVETRDAERTARHLRQAATVAMSEPADFSDFAISFHQVEDRDAWIWSLSVGGMIKLRFGLEVTDRHLVLRNLPWSTPDRVVRLESAACNGAGLSLWPGACRLQLPSLFTSAADQERRATLSGLGRLYPLLASGNLDTDTASERHQQLFGFRPLPVPGDRWIWQDGHLVSSVHGSVHRQRQPAYNPDRPFGLMQSVHSLQVTMQFEDAGLRSVIRWKLHP
jgi:hypothetical protein